MICGRCRSTSLESLGRDGHRCRECNVRLISRGPGGWLPTIFLAAAVCALPASPWLLTLALPTLIVSVLWGDSLRPAPEPSAPPPLPGARLL